MEFPVRTLLLVAAAGLAAAQTPTPVPLVNPGFEAPYKSVNLNGGTITGQVANGWTDNSSWDSATVQYAQETTNPHSGASCQKIVVTNANMQLYQKFQLQAGNIYTASAWMRGLPGTVGKLFVAQASSPYTTYFETDVALTSAWQQVSIRGYITTTEMGNLMISADGPATLWVDDAALSYIPGTIGPTPNPGLISPSFFGMHVQQFSYNQLRNSGFEPPYYSVGVQNKISGNIAANWMDNSAWADVTVAYSEDTNNPHSGVSSQKISVSAVPSGGAVQLMQPLCLLPGATYTLTAWLRGDSSTKMNLVLRQYGEPYTAYAQAGVSLTSNWKQVSVTGQVNDTGMVMALIQVVSPGTIWVDDVSVTDALGQPVSGGVPWPAAGFGTLRLWDSDTTWAVLEPQKGAWNWGPLDSFVEAAEAHGVSDILLTLGQTPGWASPTPDAVNDYGAGAAAPPADIQDWRDYVTAVAERYQGRIRYYEIWNEPNDSSYYTGTVAQLVTLTQEAYKILKAVDPANTVVSPAAYVAGYVDQLLAAGMGSYIDMLAYHIYTYTVPPESAARDLANVRLVMAKYGLAKMPLWTTEGASGDDTTPLDLAAEYIVRRYLTELVPPASIGTRGIRHRSFAWEPWRTTGGC
jgi:hypothetical protein